MIGSTQGSALRRGAVALAPVLAAVLLAAVAGACTLGDPSPGTEPGAAPGSPGGSGDGAIAAEGHRDCGPRPLANGSLVATAGGIEGAVMETSRQVFPCADRVVVAGTGLAARWTAAGEATAGGTAFLVAAPDREVALRAELRRLDPEEVVLIGVDPASRETFAGDWATSTVAADPAVPPAVPPGDGAQLWLIDTAGTDPEMAPSLAPVAAAAGAGVIETAVGDLFQLDAETRARLVAAADVQLIGSFPPAAGWQLAAMRGGRELPGGGLTILPGRRYVAFYGTPGTSSLGVLGEQDPAATVQRMGPLLAEYETDDAVTVVPTFELIATVASNEAGPDGDYSNERSVGDLRPYVDYAADNGVYVLLDLQPGRTDFLTQARRYEELLRLPHVGLALDPEWRLTDDQVHLRQFGSVDAAEINEVNAWLADLIRREGLPQKMLLIHQFNLSMVTNRSAIQDLPELSLVFQMDGQGPLGTKYGTLDALVAGHEDAPWNWGWKNFYDEDMPMATPAQTLAVVPQPVYISYQ